MRRTALAIHVALIFTAGTVLAQSVSPTPPKTRVPAPQAQRPGPPPSAPQTGTIEGHIFWNTSTVQPKTSNPCQGFTVLVRLAAAPGTQPLGSTSSTFTAPQPAKVTGYAFCAYSVHPVPIGQTLQVQMIVAPTSFNSPVSAQKLDDTMGPINIPGGNCNAQISPSASSSPPTASTQGEGRPPELVGMAGGLLGVLFRNAVSGPLRTCGPYAYNVDFLLTPPTKP